MTRQERYRARLIAQGKCRNCSSDRGADGTKTMCRACADAQIGRSAQWYVGMDWKKYAERRMFDRRQKALMRMAARNASR